MLAILISRAKEEGQVVGVVPHLVDDGLSILQYADDTIIFMDHNIQHAKNMKLLLCVFKQLSGLKINFKKSEIFCFGEAKEFENQYTQLFGCRVGNMPFQYLGISMIHRRLRNYEWQRVIEKFEKRLSNWKGHLMSTGSRLVLLNAVLNNLSIYMMSFFEIPPDVLKKLDTI
jgi:hypothetical protein